MSKPVTYVRIDDDGFISYGQSEPREDLTPLYTHHHKWQGLSDDDIMNIARESYMSRDGGDIKFARAIEQALKEKNHAGNT